jgi:hypothetical protein
MSALLDYEVYNTWRKVYLAQQQTLIRWITVEGRHIPIVERPQWKKINSMKQATHPSGVRINAEASASEELADEAYKAAAEVPPEHLEGIKSIDIKDRNSEYPDYLGCYYPEDQKIEIDAGTIEYTYARPKQQVRNCLKHEVGHHVYYTKLYADEKLEWSKLWKKYKRKMPTGYAQVSESEGFAECYACYFSSRRKRLKPEILSFFDSLFKKGG